MENKAVDGFIFTTDVGICPVLRIGINEPANEVFLVVEDIVSDVLKQLILRYRQANYVHANAAPKEV
jgi:hypothetical protein